MTVPSKILDNISADASTADADGFNPQGSRANISVEGDLGGGSVGIFASKDGGTTRFLLTYADGSPVTIVTTGSIIEINRLGMSWKIYAALAGSSGASGVTVTANN